MIHKLININALTPEAISEYYPMLSARRKQSIANLTTPTQRARQFCAEMLTRQCLSELTGQAQDSFAFLYGPGGAGLVEGSDLHIVCAFGGEYVLTAAAHCPLGADLTLLEPFNFSQTQKYLTDGELRTVFAASRIGMAQAVMEPLCTDKTAVYRLNALLSAKRACFGAMGKQLDMPYKSIEILWKDGMRCSDERLKIALSDISEDKQYILTVVERIGDS